MKERYVIFYITDGPAYCPDCASMLTTQDPEEAKYLIPVYNDATNDDDCGLLCDCGIGYDFEEQDYYDEFDLN